MNVSSILYPAILLLSMVVGAQALTVRSKTPTSERSLSELEIRLQEIDNELSQLSHLSLRSGIGSIGYRSQWHTSADTPEWVKVDLGAEYSIDSIILVPTIWRDSSQGFQSDGFPIEFKIIAGTEADQTGQVIAECSMGDADLPRIAPLLIEVEPTQASWVRIEASKLSARAFDNYYVFQLAEMMVFSQGENVALKQAITVQQKAAENGIGWNQSFLVDGATPFLMDSAIGEPSIAYLSLYYSYLTDSESMPELTVDLGSSYPLNRIHLHAVDQSDTVPQAHDGSFAIPEQLRIIGAHKADFSDAFTLIDYRRGSLNKTKPIHVLRFDEKNCRYLKLTVNRPTRLSDNTWKNRRIGFAEIECFANGENVALGKSFNDNFIDSGRAAIRKLAALTDGKNLYGATLPILQWMQELARRHDLEQERPAVETARQLAYEKQKVWLRWMSWLAILLAVSILIIVLIDRIIRLRQIAKIKERFAADLHDELGANVHTIGLLSDAAQDAHEDEADWKMLHRRIRDLSERTGTAIRHCTNMLDSKKLYIGLAEDMRRVARRNMGNFEHNMKIEGETYLSELKPRTRVDLFLFYKECLVNISRHSEATSFATELTADTNGLRLMIRDNGKGLNNLSDENIPKSLKRRAHLLRAKLEVQTTPDKGTQIILTHKNRRFLWK